MYLTVDRERCQTWVITYISEAMSLLEKINNKNIYLSEFVQKKQSH